jgi:VanZ family protein
MTIQRMLQVASVTALVLLTFVALGPATWQPRSGLGWEIDHFVGYFAFTWMFCLAWPRPLVVGLALMVFAVLLEGLQAFMPDRSSYYMAAVYSAAGVLAAALFAELFIRARRRLQSKWANGNSVKSVADNLYHFYCLKRPAG